MGSPPNDIHNGFLSGYPLKKSTDCKCEERAGHEDQEVHGSLLDEPTLSGFHAASGDGPQQQL